MTDTARPAVLECGGLYTWFLHTNATEGVGKSLEASGEGAAQISGKCPTDRIDDDEPTPAIQASGGVGMGSHTHLGATMIRIRRRIFIHASQKPSAFQDYALTTSNMTHSPLNEYFIEPLPLRWGKSESALRLGSRAGVCRINMAFLRATTSAQKPRVRPRNSTAKEERLRESRRLASEKYRERNRAKVLEAGRVRAARRRLATKDDADACARAREASARYRAENREELAMKQRKVRKRAYIKKYGVHAYIQRRFDAPLKTSKLAAPAADPASDGDDDNVDFFGPVRYDAPLISDYHDPLLRYN
ncbi:hypothetical protein B0H11DRAFT_1928522 [Mycena galericulata]|nr:hypothetical protein B0H11DRAFT_1928522 [Mycena galericulata]